ncbi:MAG TPA: hypothetical protein VK548_21910 [Candidatus Acidoferrum sp.]|nr:hypothetical protein [Candidatus Acidoferrum sp.]
MLNRRRFVYGVVSAAVLGPSLAGIARAAERSSGPTLSGRLGREVFLALRHQPFTAVIDERRVRFVLVGVTDESCCRQYEQFTVLFHGPSDVRLKDDVIVLHHATAGSVELYVQAAGTDEQATHYRASFNLRA